MIDVYHPPHSLTLMAVMWNEDTQHQITDMLTSTFRCRADVEAFQRRLALLCEMTWPHQRPDHTSRLDADGWPIRRRRIRRQRSA
jgi:hypothetical protein